MPHVAAAVGFLLRQADAANGYFGAAKLLAWAATLEYLLAFHNADMPLKKAIGNR